MKKEFAFSLINDDLIVVDVLLNMRLEVRLALDTGCTDTVITPDIIKELGFNLRKAKNTLINTGSR
jgi:predicted aspartyl protease